MQFIYLCLFIILYTVAVWGFVDTFTDLLALPFSSLQISLIISSVGIALGVLFYGISLFKSNVKGYIVSAILIIISIIFVIPYLELRIDALRESFILLIKVGIILGLCTVPSTGVYALLKKQKDTLIVSGLVIMFFFCFIRFLNGSYIFSSDQIGLFLLFFITFLCFLELVTKSFYFDLVIRKIMPNEDNYDVTLLRFNKVFNRYFVYLIIFLTASYILTSIIFWSNNSLGMFNAEKILGLEYSSVQSTLALVIILTICLLIFWYLTPSKQIKNI